jgi:hypothetical protein
MDPNLNPEIRDLPLYQLGLADGRDIGFQISLDAITQERVRQTTLQATHPANSPAAFRHEYAAARLVDVAKVIGDRFREGG